MQCIHTFKRPLAIFSSVKSDDVSSDVGLLKKRFAILATYFLILKYVALEQRITFIFNENVCKQQWWCYSFDAVIRWSVKRDSWQNRRLYYHLGGAVF